MPTRKVHQDPLLVVTQEDIKQPTLLYRVMLNFADKISQVSGRLEQVAQNIRMPTFAAIKRSLESSGEAPLNVTGLRGVLADPQPASAARYTTVPGGLVLQSLRDTQFVLVSNGAGYDLYTVIGGNPNTIFKLIAGAAGGNMMTTDTNQTPGATVVKTWTAAQIFNGGLTSGGGVTISAGQIDSDAQFGAELSTSSNQAIPTATATPISFDVETDDIGGCHDGANPTRFTCPTGGAGRWLFIGSIRYDTGAGNRRQASLLGNGGATQAVNVKPVQPGGLATTVPVMKIIRMADGDYIELVAFHDNGADLNVFTGASFTFLYGYKLS